MEIELQKEFKIMIEIIKSKFFKLKIRHENIQNYPEQQRIVTVNDCQIQTEKESRSEGNFIDIYFIKNRFWYYKFEGIH